MFRISDLLDLPIKTILGEDNTKHTVKSVLLDGNKNKIAAIVCKEGTLKKYCKTIPYERIISIDTNGVIISDENCIKKIKQNEILSYLQLEDIIKKDVKSNTGDFHGILTDIYINLLTGAITGYELSEGYLDDFMNGRRIINIDGALKDNVNNDGITIYSRLN
ncbi:MAG: hypothetical protein WBL93_01700 [Lutisporaceae bacterium]